MEAFTIHCSSCQSRIRVRNPSMIGQIANCPKCGSMIMITAPQPSVATSQQILVDSPTGSVTDSLAVTKEALPVPREGLFGELPPLEQGLDQAFRSEGLPEMALPEPAAFESLSPSSWMPEPTPPPRADEVVAHVPTEPSSSRQIMLVAAIGLCSVVVACGIFFAFLQWYARRSTVATSAAAAGQAAAAAAIDPLVGASATRPLDGDPDASAPADDTDLFATPPSEQTATHPTDTAQAPSANTQDSSVTVSTTPEDAPQNLPGAPLASAATTAGQSEANTNSANANDASATAGNATAASGAPLTSVGSGAPLGSQLMPDIDSTFANLGSDADAQAVKEALPPGLQNFASIFDQALVPVLSDATVPLGEAPETGDDGSRPNDVAVAESPMTLALPETLEQKQGTTLSGLLIQDRPLAEVISTLSLTSDIPITADLDSFLAAGVDRNQAVSFRTATPVTVQAVLGALADQYQIQFEPFEKKLLIARGSPSATQSRVVETLRIDDLVDGVDQTAALATALSELLPELGDAFQVTDGTARADLQKVNRLLWFQVARLLETWRVARGIDNSETAAPVPKSSHLPAWPIEHAHKLTEKRIAQTQLPGPLAFAWHRLASEAGMTCWIDWPSLIGAQVSPAQVGMAVTRGRPMQELLQHDADKYQVVFALEDAQTLWVTSPDMHRFQPRLYVVPLDGKTVDDWRKELEPLTPFHPDGSEALKVVASPDGQFIFIRCCRPILAQPQP